MASLAPGGDDSDSRRSRTAFLAPGGDDSDSRRSRMAPLAPGDLESQLQGLSPAASASPTPSESLAAFSLPLVPRS